ncbi:MASE3 domain-containing protein [Methanosarcina sp. MSH10X1]|uniref:MASE3 domain-containing protein n=1 Tax=Methanosarcina sp. MSH10X1 TaxID=2507075 RepID=UPI0013E3EB38|nr:MASE3 domain-containing protein [Methanosarcina sp. MSH10X1]
MKSLTIFNTPVFKLGLFLLIACVLYVISLENYLLFRIIVNLFNVIIAYMVFIIVWKSKVISENRYLTFIGTALFFVAGLGFLRAFSYREMGVFPEYGTNLPVQLWIVMRYLASISFFVAPLLLTQFPGDGKRNEKTSVSGHFAQKVFIIYSIITAVLLLSIFKYRNFPVSYIEDYGLTSFKIISEYIISFLFIGSLVLLYRKKDRFEDHVYRILTTAITISILSEFALIYYTNTEEFLNFFGLTLYALSFYLIYIAIVKTGFEDPCTLLFRELKFREEALRKETIFLKDDQGRIYRMLGVDRHIPEPEIEILQDQSLQDKTKQYKPFMQNLHGFLYFRLNERRIPVFMDGAVEEITAYSREDFVSGKMKWAEIVVPEDRPLFVGAIETVESNQDSSLELEYRIRRKDGEIRWVREIMQLIPRKSGTSEKFEGFIHDITQRKMAEESLTRSEEIRIKEIHHRIKNNLQVISSLLSLQAEKLHDREILQSSEVFEAFKESQNRVTSMALIHEELYQGKDMETLEFSAYLHRLTGDLIKSYNSGNRKISLKLQLEQVYLGMDTAVPLGIIVNELVSNSLKHAFPAGEGGEVHISLFALKDSNGEDVRGTGCKNEAPQEFILIVADNGTGIPEDLDIRNTDSLGLQLVNLLVEQIDGCIKLKKDSGTEFRILFRKQKNEISHLR